MSDDDKIYKPFNGFDGAEHRLKLKPTSKMHVKDVCTVQAWRISNADQVRCNYADQAGHKATKNEEGVREFELIDVYDEYHVHAAMAQSLFYGCPELIKVYKEDDEPRIEIVNQELFNALDEGVVNEAFLAFSADRNGIQKLRRRSSTGAQNDPN